jgi:hypothetical protein
MPSTRTALSALVLALAALAAPPAAADVDDQGGGDANGETARQTPAPKPVAADDDGVLTGLRMGSFRVDSASPGGRRLGIGLGVGWPSGINATVMLRPTHAVRLDVGAFSGLAYTEPSLSLAAAWLWHPATIATAPSFRLHVHAGLGAGVVVLPLPDQRTTLPAALYYRGRSQLWTSLRVPVGVNLALENAPVDVFFDIVPTALVFPGLALGADVSTGARLWF